MANFYLPKIVGLCGRKGSGKDTAAKILIDEYGYKLVKFAGPLKSMINALLEAQGVSLQLRERMVEGDLKEVPTGYLGGRTPRYAMQTLGTEWGRDLVDTNFWTQTFVNQINMDDNSRYVCTDMRFSNEANLVYSLGGIRIRIKRETTQNEFSSHPSELEIDNLVVDKEIVNSGTIKELQYNLASYVSTDSMRTKIIDIDGPKTNYVSVY